MNRFVMLGFLLAVGAVMAEPEFPLTADSLPQAGVEKGALIEDTYVAGEGSVFPGTERGVTIYLPAGIDKSKPMPFMVFQDGVIYQAPVVLDNLIAKGDIPPIIGLFVKPGVVPAPNDNAQPRFNRSYEYDSVTETYSKFLIDELLPALEAKHGLVFSKNPNEAAIAGNSSGGIAAFMVAWHRSDRFRRVFTGVGTYVGIRGADRLPVLIRKLEPKPLRVFLQSGTGDNDLYCGDWWLANQMMERSLTWAGYEVNHAWGEGGHNQKHASQVFPDAMRWLWKDWQMAMEVRANPEGKSQWKGYEVVEDGGWQRLVGRENGVVSAMAPNSAGEIIACFFKSLFDKPEIKLVREDGHSRMLCLLEEQENLFPLVVTRDNRVVGLAGTRSDSHSPTLIEIQLSDQVVRRIDLQKHEIYAPVLSFFDGRVLFKCWHTDRLGFVKTDGEFEEAVRLDDLIWNPSGFATSSDQTQVFVADRRQASIACYRLNGDVMDCGQAFANLELGLDAESWIVSGLCSDREGRLYALSNIGLQVVDACGRVNAVLRLPSKEGHICFGGNDHSELFFACDDGIYKRPTKAHGIVSGQMEPVKPPKPKL